MAQDHKLLLAAFDLSNAAPQQWEAFKAAFDAHTALTCEQAVQSEPGIALTAHGRAQATISINKMFKELRERVSKINK